MTSIEINKRKQLGQSRKANKGTLAKNVRVNAVHTPKTFNFNKEIQRNCILANMYTSVLIEFLDEWNSEHKAKQYQNIFKKELATYNAFFYKNFGENKTAELTHYKLINAFIDEINEIETTDNMKLFCCISHLLLLVIELAKAGMYLANKTFDMSLINFRKHLEINIDDNEFQRVMNILNQTKTLEIVKL
jgi:hypothetical protein